jgi:hypothetical protein
MVSRDVEKAYIEGLKELQEYNQRVVAGIRGPFLDKAVRETTISAQDYAISITHIWTGALKGSHRVEIKSARNEGIIFVADDTRNPRTYTPVRDYAPVEHDRGDDHAFYARTVYEYGHVAADRGVDLIMGGLRNG